MVAAFSLDIFVFLSFPYVPEVYPHCWRLLEGHLSHPGTRLTDIRLILGGYPPRTSAFHPFLMRFSILGFFQSFTPPQTYPY